MGTEKSVEGNTQGLEPAVDWNRLIMIVYVCGILICVSALIFSVINYS